MIGSELDARLRLAKWELAVSEEDIAKEEVVKAAMRVWQALTLFPGMRMTMENYGLPSACANYYRARQRRIHLEDVK